MVTVSWHAFLALAVVTHVASVLVNSSSFCITDGPLRNENGLYYGDVVADRRMTYVLPLLSFATAATFTKFQWHFSNTLCLTLSWIEVAIVVNAWCLVNTSEANLTASVEMAHAFSTSPAKVALNWWGPVLTFLVPILIFSLRDPWHGRKIVSEDGPRYSWSTVSSRQRAKTHASTNQFSSNSTVSKKPISAAPAIRTTRFIQEASGMSLWPKHDVSSVAAKRFPNIDKQGSFVAIESLDAWKEPVGEREKAMARRTLFSREQDPVGALTLFSADITAHESPLALSGWNGLARLCAEPTVPLSDDSSQVTAAQMAQRLKTVFLVRHAESTWNRGVDQVKACSCKDTWAGLCNLIWQSGVTDHPISARGAYQAEQLRQHIATGECGGAQNLWQEHVHLHKLIQSRPRVFSSPACRAVQTAHAALPVVARWGCITLLRNAREWYRGKHERDNAGGACGSALCARAEKFGEGTCGVEDRLVINDCADRWWSERPEDEVTVRTRVRSLWHQLLNENSDGCCLLVSHSNLIREMLRYYGLHLNRVQNCGVLGIKLERLEDGSWDILHATAMYGTQYVA